MEFQAGDRVHIAGIGSGVVREARNGGRYLVDVKGSALVVTAGQLAPAAAPRRPRRRMVDPAPASTARLSSRTTAAATIDLHGRTVAEAIVLLDEFLNEALLAGLSEVRVIHGRSGGRVKAAAHARLKTIAAVRGYALDPANSGVTIVRF